MPPTFASRRPSSDLRPSSSTLDRSQPPGCRSALGRRAAKNRPERRNTSAGAVETARRPSATYPRSLSCDFPNVSPSPSASASFSSPSPMPPARTFHHPTPPDAPRSAPETGAHGLEVAWAFASPRNARSETIRAKRMPATDAASSTTASFASRPAEGPQGSFRMRLRTQGLPTAMSRTVAPSQLVLRVRSRSRSQSPSSPWWDLHDGKPVQAPVGGVARRDLPASGR